MEGNFCSIYQSISSLFACKSVGANTKHKTSLCTKRNYVDESEAKELCGMKCDQSTKVLSSIKGHAACS